MAWEIRHTESGGLELEVTPTRASFRLSPRDARALGRKLISAADDADKRLQAEREKAHGRWIEEHGRQNRKE